uniref:Uncharacterized protein n=1 Tax=Sipha flava TaxID=143950 RepID=A0A2S2PXL9_9HEMI
MNEQCTAVLYAGQRAADSVHGMRLTWSHKRYRRPRAQTTTTTTIATTTTAVPAPVYRTRQMNGMRVLMTLILITTNSVVHSWSCHSDCICLSQKQVYQYPKYY